MWRFCEFAALIFAFSGSVVATNIGPITISVPRRAQELSQEELLCNPNIININENYILKWYKDGNEFYRYTSKNKDDPIELFDVTGVHVNKLLSDETTVFLEDITIQSPGIYKCEVSTDGPIPENKSVEEKMEIRFHSGQMGEEYFCYRKPFNNKKSLKVSCYFIVHGTNLLRKPWSFYWYKDDQLFYSYTPEGSTHHHLPGVYVDAQKTYKNNFVLHHLSNKTMGNYLLEISLPPRDTSEQPLKYKYEFNLTTYL